MVIVGCTAGYSSAARGIILLPASLRMGSGAWLVASLDSAQDVRWPPVQPQHLPALSLWLSLHRLSHPVPEVHAHPCARVKPSDP